MEYSLDLVRKDLSLLKEGYKTKDVDALIAGYAKKGYSIECDPKRLHNDAFLQRIYFYTHLKQIKDPEERFFFIDEHKDLFSYWWNTDSLIHFVAKCPFPFLLEKAKEYVRSDATMTARWGYVMFIFHPCKKDEEAVESLLPLFQNKEEEPLIMAEAWLLCELAIFFPQKIYDFLSSCSLSYKITSRAISKICDSYRISKEWKARFKTIRSRF